MKNRLILFVSVLSMIVFSCKKNEEKTREKHDFPSRSELFKFTPSEAEPVKRKPNPDGKFPVMAFSKTTHDFGNIKQGDQVSTEFEFTNTGDFDLTIFEAKGSCGCTIPEYPKNPIKPGEKGVIKVQFNSAGKEGKQDKSVFIAANTKSGSETLKITANINLK